MVCLHMEILILTKSNGYIHQRFHLGNRFYFCVIYLRKYYDSGSGQAVTKSQNPKGPLINNRSVPRNS